MRLIGFDPSKLDITCEEKKLMAEAVLKMLKKLQIFHTRLWLRTPMDFCRKNLLKWRLSGLASLRQARFVKSIRCPIDLFLQKPTHITICLQTFNR